MSYLSDELANVVRLDRMTEVALDLDQERRDHRDEKADENWATHVLYDQHRTGNVTPAPVNPPDRAA